MALIKQHQNEYTIDSEKQAIKNKKFMKSVSNLKAAMKISKDKIKFVEPEIMGTAEDRDLSMTATSAILPS
jgi:hypothetical protein